MSDWRWPKNIRPLTNKQYSFNRGDGVTQVRVGGGIPRSRRDLSLDSPIFPLNFTITPLAGQILDQAYNNILDNGANRFYIDIDSASGIREHFGQIVKGTWNMVRPHQGNWYLSFQFQAEFVPSQNDEFCPNLLDLYACYGDELSSIVSNLDDLVENYL